MRNLILVLLLVGGGVKAAACRFDTDCAAGSRCAVPPGSMYGVCVGSLRPGNSWDRRPVYDPTALNSKVGNTCRFDTQCGPGHQCITYGGMYGVCN